jgi:signal transduction histidine kinase
VNAFRHAGATQVELEIEYGAKAFHLLVRDDGKGIDSQVVRGGVDGHWGITGMRERAGQIGATLKIRSRSGAGTEVELKVPAAVAFERSPSGWRWWHSRGKRPASAFGKARTE